MPNATIDTNAAIDFARAQEKSLGLSISPLVKVLVGCEGGHPIVNVVTLHRAWDIWLDDAGQLEGVVA